MSDQKCREEYIRKIHKVQNYIDDHLGESLSIDELSNAAGFSKYHFSRIFQGMLQEPLAYYVKRIRMEKALFMLAHRIDKNITDITYEVGYMDSAVFSRAFKNYYGVSPREYRDEYSKNCKDSFLLSDYNKGTAEKEWADNSIPVTCNITIETLEEKQVAYVRHTGPYEVLAKEYTNLIQKLFYYADKQSLIIEDENWILAMYHDNPEFGEVQQFRTSLCLTVPKNIAVQEDGILGKMKLEGGLYAVGHFKIQQEQYSDAWNYMYQEWIAGSGYVPRNYSPFEVYRNNPSVNESHIHEVDIYLPIEPIHF